MKGKYGYFSLDSGLNEENEYIVDIMKKEIAYERPYNETYLEDVENNIGSMLEYAVCCEFDPIVIWGAFVNSKIAREIERGNPKYLSGYSGREYLDILINTSSLDSDKKPIIPDCSLNNGMYYWAGSAVSRLQFETCMSFSKIEMYLSLEEILEMYFILHEADISKFIDIAIKRIKDKKSSNKFSNDEKSYWTKSTKIS